MGFCCLKIWVSFNGRFQAFDTCNSIIVLRNIKVYGLHEVYALLWQPSLIPLVLIPMVSKNLSHLAQTQMSYLDYTSYVSKSSNLLAYQSEKWRGVPIYIYLGLNPVSQIHKSAIHDTKTLTTSEKTEILLQHYSSLQMEGHGRNLQLPPLPSILWSSYSSLIFLSHIQLYDIIIQCTKSDGEMRVQHKKAHLQRQWGHV